MGVVRLLFASLPAHGHTYPLLPLAIAAKANGHHVTFACGAAFHTILDGHGFDVVDAGVDDIRTAFAMAAGRGANADHPAMTGEQLMAAAVEAFGSIMPTAFATDLIPILRRVRPDIVVYESVNPGAAIAAKAVGLPAVGHAIGRALKESSALFDLGARLGKVAAEVGAPSDFMPRPQDGAPYLDIYPPSIQDKAFLGLDARIALRPVPYATRGELPGWVREHNEPLIYLTLGSTAFAGAGLMRTAIEGLASLPARVLVATGPEVDVRTVGEWPDNVTIQSWVPHVDLLPHIDLAVHHGGSGTTLGSAGFGVPQLIIPQGSDQFMNAEALSGAGAARQLLGEAATSEAIADAAAFLLADDGVAVAVKALADDIAAMPHPSEIVEKLPELAR